MCMFRTGLTQSCSRIQSAPCLRSSFPLQRPILGFVGTLFKFLDFDLLEMVARVHGDKSLVLLGPVEAHARDAVTRLAQLPNVVHIEGQPQRDIPGFVTAFDVCLNPFCRSEAADSVNPLKVYEYLASGRPVVSTAMKALQREDAGRMIAFAASRSEFCRLIDECLAPDVQIAVRERQEAAAPYSWERLFSRLDEACQEVFAV